MQRDLYETPEWVSRVLVPHIPKRIKTVCEPASGSGKMASILVERFKVWQSDIYPSANLDGVGDFLTSPIIKCDACITNPPYKQAEEFCRVALEHYSFVAMLLRCDFHHAKTRADLFDSPYFSKVIVLRRRIQWFESNPGEKKANPSYNHAWFVWDKHQQGPPSVAFGPKET